MAIVDAMSDVERMSVHYDGEALRDHEIDVKELGSSLIGIATMFETAQELIEPDTKLKVNMRASHDGSVVVDLMVHLYNAGGTFLTSPPVEAICNAGALAEIVFGSWKIIRSISEAHTFIDAVKKVVLSDDKGADSDSANICIELPDGTRVTASNYSFVLAANDAYVKAVKDASSPALQDGIDGIDFSIGGRSASFDKETAELIHDYSLVQSDSVVDDVEMTVQVLDASFRENGKWRVTDGLKKQFVTINDAAFFERVLSGDERVGARDLYRVVMRVEKSFDESGALKTRFLSIEKVIKHIRREQQMSLF